MISTAYRAEISLCPISCSSSPAIDCFHSANSPVTVSTGGVHRGRVIFADACMLMSRFGFAGDARGPGIECWIFWMGCGAGGEQDDQPRGAGTTTDRFNLELRDRIRTIGNYISDHRLIDGHEYLGRYNIVERAAANTSAIGRKNKSAQPLVVRL